MRTFALAAILAAVTIPGLRAEGPAKKRVAVFDFDNAAAQGGMAITLPFFQSTPPNLGKAVADLLITRLVQDGKITVIERNAIDKLLAEQNLTNSDRTDPLTAAKLGRLLGVDAIVLGSLTHYSYDDKTTGGGRRGFAGFGGDPMTTKHDVKALVQISARIVSPDTAEVLAVSQGAGEIIRKGVKMDARDTYKHTLDGAAGNPIMNEAMDKAISQLAGDLEQNVPKLPPRTPVIDGLVADANESGRLVLNVGAQNGVKQGDRLQVLRAGKEIRDPASGRVLMRDDMPLGEAVVTTVNESSSIAHYDGTEKIQVGDIVKSFPKPQ